MLPAFPIERYALRGNTMLMGPDLIPAEQFCSATSDGAVRRILLFPFGAGSRGPSKAFAIRLSTVHTGYCVSIHAAHQHSMSKNTKADRR